MNQNFLYQIITRIFLVYDTTKQINLNNRSQNQPIPQKRPTGPSSVSSFSMRHSACIASQRRGPEVEVPNSPRQTKMESSVINNQEGARPLLQGSTSLQYAEHLSLRRNQTPRVIEDIPR